MAVGKKTYITILSVISAFCVVALHMSGFWSFSTTPDWVFSNLIESVCYFPVPIFFMISGATLINYNIRYTTKQFFSKRFKRTVIPFLFFSAFSILYSVVVHKTQIENFSAYELINSIISYKYSGIYWFFPSLFTIYLCIPVIAAIPEEKRKSIFKYVILIGFILSSLVPFLVSLTNGKITSMPGLSFPIAQENLIFVFIGYYIDNYEIPKKFKYAIYILGILGLIFHFSSTYYLSQSAQYIVTTYKGYTTPHSIFYASAIFLLFKNIDFEKISSFIIKIFDFFSGQTFGVYLIHMFLIPIANKYLFIQFNDIFAYTYFYKTVGVVIIFISCALITKLLQKIPVIKHLIP